MADQKEESREKPEESGKTIEVAFRIKVPEGADVIFAKAASNHYTDHSYKSDTCCTCDT